MKYIFSEIEKLKSELSKLESTKKQVIAFIKENIYSKSLYANYDKSISTQQKAKACIYLYNNTTFEGWASAYEYPKLKENLWAKENKQADWFDFFETNKFNASSKYYNYVFELKYCKQFIEPNRISEETWRKIVADEKTTLGYTEFINEMETKDNLEYLELIEKYIDYKLIKIDCQELELENWFYAIHKSNL